MKNCTKCKESKNIDDFHNDKTRKDGKASFCKKCKIAATLDHKARNSEHFKEYRRNYKRENRDRHNELKRNERTRNRDKYLAKYQERKSEISAYFKEYRKTHRENRPVAFYGNQIRGLIHSSFKFYTGKSKRPSKSEPILGCDIAFFRKYIESKFKPGMTFDNYGEWHLDHIIPLATAKTNNDVLRLNHFSNFQPLWAIENMRKASRVDMATG